MRLAANCRDDLFAKCFGFDIGDMKRAAFAIALDQRHNSMLFRLFLRMGAVLSFAAEHRFIAFDNLAFATDRAWLGGIHRFANAMAHKPSRAIGAKAKHPPKLMRAHSLFAGAHEMRGKKPFMHGNMRTFVNSADRCGELLHAFTAAMKAVAGSFANDRIGRIDDAAVRTNRTIRPTHTFEMFPSCIFVIENRVCEIDGHLRAPMLPTISHILACLSSA